MDIVTIKGTDSLASSRLTINSNFEAIKNDFANISKIVSTGSFSNISTTGDLRVGSNFVANSNGLSINKVNVADELNIEKLLISQVNKITVADASSNNNKIDLSKSNVHLIASSNVFDKAFSFIGNATNGTKHTIISDGPTAIFNNTFVGYSSVKVRNGGAIEIFIADGKKFIISHNSKVELA